MSDAIKESGGSPQAGPLQGVRVLDCGTAVVGPWAAMMLAYLGADVIKVERPSGELTRLARPRQNGWSTAYVATNLCKRSIELDFKDPANASLIERLLTEADVVIENYRPGVAERIGIGYGQARAANPAVVYGSSSGWGDLGPMKAMSAVDSHLQAFSGFASLNGAPGGQPEMVRYTHIDPSGGTFLAAGLLLGLVARERYGQSTEIVTSHLAMTLTMQAARIAETLATGEPVPRLGSACTASVPNQCFQTKDGSYLALTVNTDEQWKALCAVLGDAALAEDERFATNVLRVKHRGDVVAAVAGHIARQPLRWWIIKLRAAGVPASPVLTGQSIVTHAHMWEAGYLTEVAPEHTGPFTTGGLPWRFSKTPASMDRPTPLPGSNTDQVREHGFGPDARERTNPNTSNENTLPLSGLRVVELCQGIAGPHIGLLLAETGAEVVKIEPAGGDWTRGLAPQTDDGHSAVFDALNRNKTVMSLDASDVNELAEHVAGADIILMDWSPNSDDLFTNVVQKASSDTAVILRLSDHGESGPLAGAPASELTLQALTGYLRTLGRLDGEPVRVGADIAESATVAMGLVGVLSALVHKERSGEGQTVAVSRLGALMSLRSLQWAAISNPDEWAGPSYCLAETDPPRHGYRTADSNIFVSMMNLRDSSQFTSMLDELGMMDAVKDDETFMSEGKTTIGMGYLSGTYHALWEQHLMQLPSQEVLDIFNRNGATAVDFPELDALMDHDQVAALDLVETVDGRRYLRAPWRGPWTYPTVSPVSKKDG